jgi:hypothetical protein
MSKERLNYFPEVELSALLHLHVHVAVRDAVDEFPHASIAVNVLVL